MALDVTQRAFIAYVRSDAPAWPSGEVTHDGRRYVVLRSGGRVLAVYRVTGRGALKRLKRWPPAVVESPVNPNASG